jgi:hypothetical protein
MSGIWRSPVPKSKTAIRSPQRTTTSTPNIISDRCARTRTGRNRIFRGGTSWRSAINEKQPTYRIEMKNSGQPPNENYGWKIYRNSDVLPILHSQQFFVSRTAGLADANRSRRQLVDTDMQSQTTSEQ